MSSLKTVRGARESIYFFLSYAHTPPTPGRDHASADQVWVMKFFHDLEKAVGRLALASGRLGFAEQLPIGGDWRTAVSHALGSAEVFVPLYSPIYLTRSWPRRQQASFRQRLRGRTDAQAERHIQPVLWVPTQPDEGLPDSALSLGGGIPEYTTNGVLSLCRLSIFEPQYTEILSRLAKRIVTVAEQSPLGPAGPMHIPDDPDDHQPSVEVPLVVGAVAPTAATVPDTRMPAPYGQDGITWRPFGGGAALRAVDYASAVAERLGFCATIVDLWQNPNAMGSAPSVAIVDPWIIAIPGGRQRLQAANAEWPTWATAIVLMDESDPQYNSQGEHLVSGAMEILGRDHLRPVRYAKDPLSLVEVAPQMIAESRRRYLSRQSR